MPPKGAPRWPSQLTDSWFHLRVLGSTPPVGPCSVGSLLVPLLLSLLLPLMLSVSKNKQTNLRERTKKKKKSPKETDPPPRKTAIFTLLWTAGERALSEIAVKV